MAKEFKPYSDLWLNAHKWRIGNVSWLKDPWVDLKATEAEKFVDDAFRALTGVIRFFKDRDLTAMMKIAQTIKGEIEEFKPKVPLMVTHLFVCFCCIKIY